MVSLDTLSGIYSPYLGAILAYYFVVRLRTGKNRKTSRGTFAIAMGASGIWNGFILLMLVLVACGSMGVEDALQYVNTFATKLSWLVAPLIGYFFAKSETSSGVGD